MCCRAIFYLCAFEHPIEDMTRGAAAGLGGSDAFPVQPAKRRLARLGAAALGHVRLWGLIKVAANAISRAEAVAETE